MALLYNAIASKELRDHAVDERVAEAAGLRSTNSGRGFVMPWPDVNGQSHDIPRLHTAHRRPGEHKVNWPAGFSPGLKLVRPGAQEGAPLVLVVEGYMQSLAVASWVASEVWVYAMNGCDGIHAKTDLAWAAGQRFGVMFDADVATNGRVTEASERVARHLYAAGARQVLILTSGGTGKEGIDDVLARLATDTARRWHLTERLSAPIQMPDGEPLVRAGSVLRQTTGGLPEVLIGSSVAAVEWLRQTLGTGRLAGFFLRDGDLVHCPSEGEEGYIPPADEGDYDGPAQVRGVTPGQVRARVQANYRVVKEKITEDEDGNQVKERVSILFPRDAAPLITDAPDSAPNLRRLRGVTHTPLVRADGSVLDAPGYDPGTGLLFLPDSGLVVPRVPAEPSTDQVRAALALIAKMIDGFPFVSEHDRANYIGLLLTPILRQMLRPPYKLGIFTAPMRRSGKTLLTTVLRILHGGVFRSEWPAEEAEVSKTLSTILNVTTAPVVTFDNITGTLKSGTLDGMLSSPTFDARQLGTTQQMITRRNDRLWTITSNNATLGGDLVSRSLWVAIDSAAPHPEARTGFAIGDLPGWCREHRGEVLASLLVLVRAWVVAGRPVGPEVGDVWGTWIRGVRGILTHAGVAGTFGGSESAGQEISGEDEEAGTFLAAVESVLGGKAWTVRELLVRVVPGPGHYPVVEVGHPFPPAPDHLSEDVLPATVQDRPIAARARVLGKWLQFRRGAWYDGRCVRVAGADHGRQQWQIVRYR